MSDPVLSAALRDWYENDPEDVAAVRAEVSTWHPASEYTQGLWRAARKQYIKQQLELARSHEHGSQG